jgi:hypothetical protein
LGRGNGMSASALCVQRAVIRCADVGTRKALRMTHVPTVRTSTIPRYTPDIP